MMCVFVLCQVSRTSAAANKRICRINIKLRNQYNSA